MNRTFLVFLMAACCFTFSSNAVSRRPNVILMMADDCGYESLACNGSTSYKTPHFDRIAAKGMRFTQCYSQPVCTPSRVKIMTGQSNARNYISFGVLREGEVTFGKVMKEAGYKTCIAGKWQLSGNGSQGMWWQDCGFDESCIWAYAHYLKPKDLEHYRSTNSLKKRKTSSRFWNPSIIENGKYRPSTSEDFGPDIYSDFILDFIERNKDEEFFVYYPMALTHGPFIPTPHSKNSPEKDKFSSHNKYYGDMVRYTGYLMERIIQQLEKSGIAENTLILFTGDNGTGRGIESWMGDRLIMGGKAFPIDAGTHVPMLAYWKGTIQAGSVCNDLIDFSDFMPSIAKLGKAKLPTDRILDGRSFLAQLKGKKGNPREAVLIHYDKDPNSKSPKFRRVRFAYDGKYKLYSNGNMFDVHQDYLEQSALSTASLSPSAIKAKSNLQSILKQLPKWNPDNSSFGDKPSAQFQKMLNDYQKVIKSKSKK
ncbi:MAG TPA: arylsulfatase [Verrucomicrobiales bacterium]|nr:arylsulfatase [Verrucomicrobiales bacterium]HIL70508.1 arylsulfatase [Verrucomicrobiota bacterium]